MPADLIWNEQNDLCCFTHHSGCVVKEQTIHNQPIENDFPNLATYPVYHITHVWNACEVTYSGWRQSINSTNIELEFCDQLTWNVSWTDRGRKSALTFLWANVFSRWKHSQCSKNMKLLNIGWRASEKWRTATLYTWKWFISKEGVTWCTV